MRSAPLKVFLIAGESSGDVLGAKLMWALRRQTKDNIEFYGVGGPQMQKHELYSIFPMSDLAVMGFSEVITHIPTILLRMWQTRRAIKKVRPDVVITIDSPDFCFRVVKKLQRFRKKNIVPFIHYVAPSVWAYREKRAKKIAKLYDHLLALLPFEPPYFTKYGLNITFVGHPIVEDTMLKVKAENFHNKFVISHDLPILTMMPGSRVGEVERHLPIFTNAIKLLVKRGLKFLVIVPTVKHVHEEVSDAAKDWPVSHLIIGSNDDKISAFLASTAALVKSGTGALELAVMDVPMIVAYKVSPFSAWLARKLLKVRYVNLVNIILDREAIPEFLQERCEATLLADALEGLLTDSTAREKQLFLSEQALKQLGKDQKPTPSERAADVVIHEVIDARNTIVE